LTPRLAAVITTFLPLAFAFACGSSASDGGARADAGALPGSAATQTPPDTSSARIDASEGPACKTHADCKTGCGDDGRCATAPSCTRGLGGRSCGADGNDDCCAVIQQGDYKIDKYLITAGRMRAFIERFDGNVQGFIDGLPAGKWDPSWTEDGSIPTTAESANVALGPAQKKSCQQGDFNGHTYWTPPTDTDKSDFDQTALDPKALNCVSWQLLQALCIFDGGHLATLDELRAAFTNGSTTAFPWGDDALANIDAPDPDGKLNIAFAYATSPIPGTLTHTDNNGKPTETPFFISPPGVFPKGNNKVGIADAAGNLLEWVGDQRRQFVWKADFEHHAKDAAQIINHDGKTFWSEKDTTPIIGTNGPWIWGANMLAGNAGSDGTGNKPDERFGYYAIGGRCAH
jgi:formylglycine-generating enzyme required for sulfatase activity